MLSLASVRVKEVQKAAADAWPLGPKPNVDSAALSRERARRPVTWHLSAYGVPGLFRRGSRVLGILRLLLGQQVGQERVKLRVRDHIPEICRHGGKL
jgi:hypothetical protein